MGVDLIDTISDDIPLALFHLKSYAETDLSLRGNWSINILKAKNFNPKVTVDYIENNNIVIISLILCFEHGKHSNDLWWTKKINCYVNIIVGSPDAISVPVRSLTNYCLIYLLVCGEGEETFRDILHYWETIK